MSKLLLLNNDRKLVQAVTELAPDWQIEIAEETLNAPNSPLGDADVTIVVGFGHMVADVVTHCPNLKWLQTWSAGVDAVPLELLKAQNVCLTNVSGVHAKPISESIFAFMLSFARGLHFAEGTQREARWSSEVNRLWEIHDQTLGILGAGAIGTETARLAKAFGMRTIGLTRSGGVREHFDETVVDPTALYRESDCVANILPLTAATRRFVSSAAFEQMKPTACYVTVGRGPTTDFNALQTALTTKQIAFAGIDVTDPEPLPADSPLWAMPNILITPHFSGATPFYNSRGRDIFIENFKSFLATGKPCRNIVDLTEGY
jgi:phosphoglycerate dehydrogenase-like enzyme